MTNTYEAYVRLSKLLPKLAALTDRRRLEVLSDIDRVLAASGMTWEDIADAVMPPRLDIATKTALAMIERITKHPDILTENASDFLSQVAENMKGQDAATLSPRQAEWLHALDERAKAAEAAEAKRIQPSLGSGPTSQTKQQPKLQVIAANGNEDESTTLH
jgi:hypothetical protein